MKQEERAHVLSMQCWCKPVMDSFGSQRQARLPCATGEHRYHWSTTQAQACQAVAERLREANSAE